MAEHNTTVPSSAQIDTLNSWKNTASRTHTVPTLLSSSNIFSLSNQQQITTLKNGKIESLISTHGKNLTNKQADILLESNEFKRNLLKIKVLDRFMFLFQVRTFRYMSDSSRLCNFWFSKVGQLEKIYHYSKSLLYLCLQYVTSKTKNIVYRK